MSLLQVQVRKCRIRNHCLENDAREHFSQSTYFFPHDFLLLAQPLPFSLVLLLPHLPQPSLHTSNGDGACRRCAHRFPAAEDTYVIA